MIESAPGLRPRPSARLTILVVAGLILITAAVRIPLLRVPFERDEGEYAYIAWRLGHNELPYRDWVAEMTKIKETGFENRENVFFHRFCGHKHLFRLHQPRFPRTRIYRIDYPDSN